MTAFSTGNVDPPELSSDRQLSLQKELPVSDS